MDKNLYAIQVGNNTYIDWCDNNWYGVETFPLYKFTKEEVLTIIKQLQSHFKYKVIASNQNNEQLFFEFGKEVKFPPKFKTVVYHSIEEEEIMETQPDPFMSMAW
jgi:hypothetical protein